MKLAQRVYESTDYNNVYLKTNHTVQHKKNLDEIKNRKPQFEVNLFRKSEKEDPSSPAKSPKKRYFDMSKY
jgi:hypothetical protein